MNYTSSVIRQKDESENGCFKYARTCAYQGVRNVGFSENLACFEIQFEIRPFALLPTAYFL